MFQTNFLNNVTPFTVQNASAVSSGLPQYMQTAPAYSNPTFDFTGVYSTINALSFGDPSASLPESMTLGILLGQASAATNYESVVSGINSDLSTTEVSGPVTYSSSLLNTSMAMLNQSMSGVADIADTSTLLEDYLVEFEEDLADAQKEETKLSERISSKEARLDTVESRVTTLRSQITGLEQKKVSSENTTQSLVNEIQGLSSKATTNLANARIAADAGEEVIVDDTVNLELQLIKVKLDVEREVVNSTQNQISSIQAEINLLLSEQADLRDEIDDDKADLEDAKDDVEDAEKYLAQAVVQKKKAFASVEQMNQQREANIQLQLSQLQL